MIGFPSGLRSLSQLKQNYYYIENCVVLRDITVQIPLLYFVNEINLRHRFDTVIKETSGHFFHPVAA